jgi:hypothetical protein
MSNFTLPELPSTGKGNIMVAQIDGVFESIFFGFFFLINLFAGKDFHARLE